MAGAAFALIAALFGDIALDHTVATGFAAGPLEVHETVAVITLSVFTLYAALRLLAIWRRYPLTGIRDWLAELPGWSASADCL